jgi:hypothetical protein
MTMNGGSIRPGARDISEPGIRNTIYTERTGVITVTNGIITAAKTLLNMMTSMMTGGTTRINSGGMMTHMTGAMILILKAGISMNINISTRVDGIDSKTIRTYRL